MHAVAGVWDWFLQLLYPPVCCACGSPTHRPGFCRSCRRGIHAIASPSCSICGAPFRSGVGTDHLCGRCLVQPPHFRRARACAIYDAAASPTDPLKRTLQRYKYNRDVSLAPILGQLVRDHAPLAPATYDLIIPVPLHIDRLRWRGFNQAQLLAQRVTAGSGVRLDAFALERNRPTRPQVELDERERKQNVARAFQVRHPDRVDKRRILLVDDVLTTGATVDECSRVLLRAGARYVDVLVLARAVQH